MPAIEDCLILEIGADYGVAGWITDDFGSYVDISGDTFTADLLDAEGGTVIDSFTMSVVLDTSVTPNRYVYKREMTAAEIALLGVTEGHWNQYWTSASTGKTAKMFSGDFVVKAE